MGEIGRPATYVPAYADTAEKLSRLGATDMEIAEFFEVDVRTIYRWKVMYPDFCQALKAGKDAADDRVERSLYQRALGYSHPAVKLFQFEGSVVEAPYTEHYPPDTTAAIFWLKNRRRADWRDVHQVEGSGGAFGGIKIVLGGDGKVESVEVSSAASSGTEPAAPAHLPKGNGRTKP